MTDRGFLYRRLRNVKGLTADQLARALCDYIEACDRNEQPLAHEDNVFSAVLFVTKRAK